MPGSESAYACLPSCFQGRQRHSLGEDVETDLDLGVLVPRNRDVALRGGDSDRLARGGLATPMRQIHLDGELRSVDRHLDVFHFDCSCCYGEQ